MAIWVNLAFVVYFIVVVGLSIAWLLADKESQTAILNMGIGATIIFPAMYIIGFEFKIWGGDTKRDTVDNILKVAKGESVFIKGENGESEFIGSGQRNNLNQSDV